mgnify:CR=1 FL=1
MERFSLRTWPEHECLRTLWHCWLRIGLFKTQTLTRISTASSVEEWEKANCHKTLTFMCIEAGNDLNAITICVIYHYKNTWHPLSFYADNFVSIVSWIGFNARNVLFSETSLNKDNKIQKQYIHLCLDQKKDYDFLWAHTTFKV